MEVDLDLLLKVFGYSFYVSVFAYLAWMSYRLFRYPLDCVEVLVELDVSVPDIHPFLFSSWLVFGMIVLCVLLNIVGR